MEKFVLKEDINVFYVKAKSFPDGIEESHRKIHEIASKHPDRKYFGMSRPEEELDGEIGYKACVTEVFAGEAKKLNFPMLTIRKGNYISIFVDNYIDDVTRVTRAFEELLERSDLDSRGYCVEWYVIDKDVRCMIRLED